MLRMIAKWMISRSIDENRAMPAWIQRKIETDEKLKQFELRSRQLGDRLKSDAAGWIAPQSRPVTKPLPQAHGALADKGIRRNVSLSSVGIMALAATILVAVLLNRSYKDSLTQPGPRSKQSIAVTEPNGATGPAALKIYEWLIKSTTKSRAALEQFQSNTGDLPTRIEDLKLPSLSQIVEPAKVAGATAGRAYVALDQGLETEQKLLSSELKTALSFFTHRLPAGVAKLAGRRSEG